jgi:hypothetical protein
MLIFLMGQRHPSSLRVHLYIWVRNEMEGNEGRQDSFAFDVRTEHHAMYYVVNFSYSHRWCAILDIWMVV